MLNKISPKKSLGQNFLQDKNISNKIVESLKLSADDIVFEIGPGEGALTQFLSKKTKNLIAIEIDQRCVALLKENFGNKIEIINKNFLEYQFPKILKSKIRLVGNIPYNITSQILFKIFNDLEMIKDFTAMMQKEVAMRLVAKPKTKDYGILSVMAQYYSNPKILFDVSKNCFYPKPKVTSTVVNLNFDGEKKNSAIDENLFRSLVRGTFNTRRKTIRNGLKFLNAPEESFLLAEEFLSKRPEELSTKDFVDLSNLFSRNGVKLNARI